MPRCALTWLVLVLVVPWSTLAQEERPAGSTSGSMPWLPE